MPDAVVRRTGDGHAAKPGQRGLDPGRPQQVVHPVLREGFGDGAPRPHPPALRSTPINSPSSSQARLGDLLVAPLARAEVVDTAERGPQQHLPLAREVRPLAVQEGARGDRPGLAALAGAAPRYQETGAVQGRWDVVGADAEGDQHDRGVVDRLQQAGRLVVVGMQEGGRGRCGRGQHHGVGLDRLACRSRGPSVTRPDGADRPGPTAARPRRARADARRAPATSDAMPPSSDQKSGGPSGSGAGTSDRSARMRPPRRWAAARSGGKVAAADMSSTEPAWMPPMRGSTRTSTTWCPSLRATRGPIERSPIGPRTSGRGNTASRARPSTPGSPRTPLRAVGQNRGRDARSRALRGARAGAPWPTRTRPRAQIGTERVAETDLAAQLDRLGPAPEETVGAHVDGASFEGIAAQRAAEARRCLEDHHARRVAPALGPSGQCPRRGQPADAAADDDHPTRRHVRWRRPPR